MNSLFAFGLLEIGGVVLVVLVILALINFRALRRIFDATRAQAGKLGRWAKERDPLAVYQEKIDNGTEKIAAARQHVQRAAGEVRGAARRVVELEAEVAELNRRIDVAEGAGDPNKTVDGYALKLADAEESLEKARTTQTRAKERFEGFTASVNEGKTLVDQARREARELGMDLEQSQREKEMNEFAASFNPSSVLGDDSLSEARAAVLRKIDENRGAADADAAMNQQHSRESADRDLERKARAKEILARRAAAKDRPPEAGHDHNHG